MDEGCRGPAARAGGVSADGRSKGAKGTVRDVSGRETIG